MDEYFIITHFVSVEYRCDAIAKIVVKGRHAVADYVQKNVVLVPKGEAYKMARFMERQSDTAHIVGDVYQPGDTYHMALVDKLTAKPEI